ncbi:MAG: hypothetical protein JXA04_10155 [Gammaproteobacteria bacterium]|nr:hypothetical protein [Gammaproteobacteria bacterium]
MIKYSYLVLIVLSLTACGGGSGDDESSSSNSSNSSSSGSSYIVTKTQTVELLDSSDTVLFTFTTIQDCADIVEAGQTCLVYPGTYSEGIRTIKSGTPENRITFRADNPAATYTQPGISISTQAENTAVIQGENLYQDEYVYGAIVIEHDYITVEGFEIFFYPSDCFRNGIVNFGSHTEITNNYIHDISGGAGITTGGDDGFVAYNRIANMNKGLNLYGNRTLVEYNDFSRMIYDCQDADFMRAFGSNHIIRYNYFHDNYGEELPTNLTHPDVIQTFGDSIAQNISFEYNFIKDLEHTQMCNLETDGTGISNWSFKNNIIYNLSGSAFIWIPRVVFSRNTIIYTSFDTIFLWYRSGSGGSSNYGVVKNNLFIDTGINPRNSLYSVETGVIDFLGDYNYIAGAPPYFSEKTNWTDIEELNGINGGDPSFMDITNPLGPDGIPWTDDDGLRLQSESTAIGVGENGVDIGAYDFQTN